MAWITAGRAPVGVIAGAALVISGLCAAPAALAAPAGAHPGATAATERAALTPAALTRAYTVGRRLPRNAVGGIRPGSLRVAAAPGAGARWATAAFTPSRAAGPKVTAEFQDGASTGVFTETAGHPWHLVQVTAEPSSCGLDVPAAVRAAWHMAEPAACHTPQAAAKRAAQRARAAIPADGTIGQQAANIALSEVGVSDTPAVTNFNGVDCDPFTALVGPPTPNSNGCGPNSNFHVVDEDEFWCSDFAKWVWEQAGVTADINTLNAGSTSFYTWGLDQGEPMPVDPATPAVGDAVVFFPPGPIKEGGFANHVGIVTAVNPDGTINMANGDFAGGPDVSVQYNTDLDLATWSSQVWGSGEQWVYVTPPTTPQQPAPQAHILGPRDAVAGTQTGFLGTAHEQGGSISSYQWTFGDGGTATGQTAGHVFANAGQWTVALTATSNFGTATTATWTVDVVSSSSAVASTPNDSVWYTTVPVDQDLITLSASGGLAAETWDGAGWLDQAIGGQPAAGSPLATLNYPGASDVQVPQVFYRAPDGTLAQTSGGDGNWSASELTGQPSATSGIAATTVPSASSARGAAPAVFYFNAAGQLSESSINGSGDWSAQTLPGPATSQTALAVANVPGLSQPTPMVFYASGQSALTMVSSDASGWHASTISSPLGIAAGSPLAALSSGPGGVAANVFFIDGNGQVAQASSLLGQGHWTVSELPGPAAGTGSGAGLTAAGYQLASGSVRPEVYYLGSGGQPVLDAFSGGQWQSSTLPGTASAILGAAAYPAAGGPQQLFLNGSSGTQEDAATTAGGAWAASSLPSTPATFGDRVLLYAATPADYQNAVAAATAAGLPAAQVTDSYATAWAATLSGDYLVIEVGQAALNALYLNACGWPNPSAEDPGTTPFFYYANQPINQLLGPDAFINGNPASSSQAVALATDLAYYALNGQLPSGVTSLPPAKGATSACLGTPAG